MRWATSHQHFSPLDDSNLFFSGRPDDNKAQPGCYDAITATAETSAKDGEEDGTELGGGEEEDQQQADKEGEEGGGGGERLGRKLDIQPGSGRWA